MKHPFRTWALFSASFPQSHLGIIHPVFYNKDILLSEKLTATTPSLEPMFLFPKISCKTVSCHFLAKTATFRLFQSRCAHKMHWDLNGFHLNGALSVLQAENCRTLVRAWRLGRREVSRSKPTHHCRRFELNLSAPRGVSRWKHQIHTKSFSHAARI